MAVHSSQRPKRIPPSPTAANKSAPITTDASSRQYKLLLAILIASFSAYLIFPPIGTWLLEPTPAELANKLPVDLTKRIQAFLFIAFGVWGLMLYTWSCWQYSLTKGRAGGWGMAALLGGTALVGLEITGNPIAGLFAVLSLAGFIIPFATGDDPLQRLARQDRSHISSGATLFAAFGLFVGISIAYGNSFYGEMTLDNKYIISEYYKQLLRQDPTLDVLSSKMLGNIFFNDYWWPKGISGLYRPLATLSYWANYVFDENKLDPFQYHVVNFVLHWIAACLGFVLIRLLSGRTWIAFASALLFVTHPIATESVTNIIGRADVMAACATFAGIILYIRSTRTQHWLKWVYLVLLMIVTLLGVFAKESAIAIVGVMVVYDLVYRWNRDDFYNATPTLLCICAVSIIGLTLALLVGKFGFLGLSDGVIPALAVVLVASAISAVIVVTLGVSRRDPNWLFPQDWFAPWEKFFIAYLSIVPPIIAWIAARGYVFYRAAPPETPFLDNPIRGLSFFAARMTAMDVFVRLIGLLVWPLRLSCDYSFNQIPLFNGSARSPETWVACMGALTLISVFVLALVFYRKQKAICFLLLFYLVVYLPTSNFLIIIGSIMAERFLYLPLLAFSACLVFAIDAVLRRYSNKSGVSVQLGIVVLLCILYSVRTWERNKDWLSDNTLWASAIKVSPHSFRSYQSGAFALYEQLNATEAAGGYKSDPAEFAADLDNLIATAERAKPIVDVLPPKENSSRLYLHLGMYYTKKGDFLAHVLPDGLVAADDPAIGWYRNAERVLQQGVVIDRTFNGVNREREIARKIRKPDEIADVGLPPVYSCLGYDYAQLSEWSKALQCFQYTVHLDPTDPDSFFKIGMTELRQDRFEAAAATFLQCLILNQGFNSVWQPMRLAFSKIQPDGSQAVVVSKDNRVQLNLQTAAAKSAMCSAYQNFVLQFKQSKRFAAAKQFSDAAKAIGFPQALFDDLLNSEDQNVPVPPPAD